MQTLEPSRNPESLQNEAPNISDSQGVDHRRAPRFRTFKAGRIWFNDDFSTIDCTIRNVSDTGAMLSVVSVFDIPRHFSLEFRREGVRRRCEVMWRRTQTLGVRYLD